MAFRRSTRGSARRSARRSTSRSVGARRQNRGNGRAARGAVHTVRVVVEQPGASPLSRPELSGLTPAPKPAKAKF